jgi:hypothetical protein
MNEQLLNTLVKALEFYANGENTHIILNRRGIDFYTAREELENKGFSFDSENYNGDEVYIEDGRTAREALAELKKYMEENNESTG